MNDSIGIDISKDHLDVYRTSGKQSAQFPNSAAGFAALRKWIGKQTPARVVYEPTGPYHAAFEKKLAGELPLVKVNPLQARRFAQARGIRAKTDAVDARMLATMGHAFDLVPDQPRREELSVLKELQVARQALIKDQTRLKNRMQTQTISLLKRQSKARLDQIKRQLAQLDAQINARIHDCPDRAQALAIIQSIPGLGTVTAATILIEMPEIGTLSNKAVASLAGLALSVQAESLER